MQGKRMVGTLQGWANEVRTIVTRGWTSELSDTFPASKHMEYKFGSKWKQEDVRSLAK